MKRLLLNGSPRGAASNSRIIIDCITKGLLEAGAASPAVLDLARVKERAAHHDAFLDADEVVLVFPLYTDSVPGIVKAFIDTLADVDPARLRGKRFGFIVHSGFPESAQSEPVTLYMKRLCGRLGMTFIGRAIKGGSGRIRIMSDSKTRNIREDFAAVGRSLERNGRFDEKVVERLARPRRLGRGDLILWSILLFFGLPDYFWKVLQKKLGGWKKRLDQPYLKYVKSNG
jgi:multimeric flavodoxin WrbA